MKLMDKLKVKNIGCITNLKNVPISAMDNHDERIEQAMHEVLQNKAVYNALKRLADE